MGGDQSKRKPSSNANDDANDYDFTPETNETIEECMITVNDIISQGQPWTDNDFPPEAASICGKNDKISYKKSVTWKRMSEVYPDADIF